MAILIEEVEVGTTLIRVKFARTVKVSSITNDRFSLATDEATPVTVGDPFDPIEISNDYNTISRILTLRYSDEIEVSTDYIFTISGLTDPLGQTIGTESVAFTTPAVIDTGPSTGAGGGDTGGGLGTGSSTGGDIDYSVEIEDHTLSGDELFGDTVVDVPNTAFYIVMTDPLKGDPVVTTGYNDGRISLTFSQRPAAQYANATYIKAHKKKLQREYTRWEEVPVLVSADTVKPVLYVDFPSTDATPVYHMTGKEYFPLDYKFRVRASKDIDVAATSDLPNISGHLDLVIEQGATFQKVLTLLQPSGVARDLTGYTARMQIRAVLTGPVVLELTTENGGIVIEEVAGRVHLEITDVQTSALTIRSGVYDLEMVSAGATPVVTRLLSGKVTVSPEVTR